MPDDLNKVLVAPVNWKRVARLEHGIWNSVVKMRCPKCEKWQDVIDHAISSEGFITPSVICAEDCGFHAMCALEQYTEERLVGDQDG